MPRFFNTLTRQKEEIKPIRDREVGMYTCGPTVYDFAHIGNFRSYIFADLLKRALLADKLAVKHIMNITDVGHLTGDRDMGEDKLAAAAARKQKTAWEIASYYTEAFLADARELNILTPDKLVKATDHIADMIELIKTLEAKGFTYKTSDGVYFDTSKLSDYGKLARLDIKGLEEGARVEVNKEKRNSTDFALWKFSHPLPNPPHPPAGEAGKGEGIEKKEFLPPGGGGKVGGGRDMEWSSPWGVGFPGWHIECSAMSVKYLGQPFDIHTGGIDFIPLHHTNELAQSEAAAGKPLANVWMHNDFVMVNDGRMGKSEGNLITLAEIKKRGISPLAYRYFVLGAHYRSKLNFTWEALEGAQNALDNLCSAAAEFGEPSTGCPEFERDFLAAINDDLDTPKALAVMWEMIKSGNEGAAKLKSLLEFDKILGLSIAETREELRRPLPEEVKVLVAEREKMREQKKWREADELRAKIEELGFQARDTDADPLVRKKP